MTTRGDDMKRHESYLAQCPFYISEDSNRVLCEGIEEDSTIHIVFQSSTKKREYCKKHCRDNYKACKVSVMLFSMYGGDGE